jgi:hypothetical protein
MCAYEISSGGVVNIVSVPETHTSFPVTGREGQSVVAISVTHESPLFETRLKVCRGFPWERSTLPRRGQDWREHFIKGDPKLRTRIAPAGGWQPSEIIALSPNPCNYKGTYTTLYSLLAPKNKFTTLKNAPNKYGSTYPSMVIRRDMRSLLLT